MAQPNTYLEDKMLAINITLDQAKSLQNCYNRREVPIIPDEEFWQLLYSIGRISPYHIDTTLKGYFLKREEELNSNWDSVRFDLIIEGSNLFETYKEQRLFTNFLSLSSLSSVKKFISILLPKMFQYGLQEREPLNPKSLPSLLVSQPNKCSSPLRRSARIAQQTDRKARERKRIRQKANRETYVAYSPTSSIYTNSIEVEHFVYL